MLAVDSGGLPDGGGVKIAGGYRRGVFVRAARGSSIDIGLFHDDQRRSVATVEMWVNAGEKVRGSRITHACISRRWSRVGRGARISENASAVEPCSRAALDDFFQGQSVCILGGGERWARVSAFTLQESLQFRKNPARSLAFA